MITFKQLFEATDGINPFEGLQHIDDMINPENPVCYGYLDVGQHGNFHTEKFTLPVPITLKPNFELIVPGVYKLKGIKGRRHTLNYMQLYITDERLWDRIQNDPEFIISDLWGDVLNLIGLPD